MPNGMIQPENVDTLLAIGKWMDKYGESIYGTRKGPIKPLNWGATTQKDNTIYLHIIQLAEENLLIPNFPQKIKSATFFDDGSKVKFEKTSYGTLIHIPYEMRKNIDTIIKVEI